MGCEAFTGMSSAATPQKATLSDIIERIDQLPQPPEVAMKASKLLEDPNCTAEQLAGLIKLDTGMTTQVLRLCNSASYGLNRKIETIKDAVAMMGFTALKSLVYTVLSHGTLNKPLQGYGLDKGALWINAVTCGVYAKYLAQQFQLQFPKQVSVDPEVIYTAAMLRDIGKLVLNDYVKQNYPKIAETAREEAIDFMEAEAEIIGFSHTTVGVQIADKWNLPERLSLAIGYHHTPSQLPTETSPADRQLVTLVHMADAFTMMLGSGIGGDGMMYSLDIKSIQDLGCNWDTQLDNIMAQLVDLNQVVKGLTESLLPVSSAKQ
jgi:putative nucleotidyltransferase with HDIG domain